MLESTRQLASIERIHSIRPIPQADAIEVGSVRGWDVVVRKGEFSEGECVIFIEPDAALPLSDERFAFLGPRGTKTIDGELYHVLKTAKLRGQVSQGIVFPCHQFDDVVSATGAGHEGSIDDRLGILLWEPPIPLGAAGIIGAWDIGWLKKTDAERVQNLSDEWLQTQVAEGREWVATEKLDGSSHTVTISPEGKVRIYGRNWELDQDSTIGTVVADLNLGQWMADNQIDAVQGELVGEGVNGNRLKLKGHKLFLFSAWANRDGVAVNRFPILHAEGVASGLDVVPIVALPFPSTVHEAVEQADGPSAVNPKVIREGIVWHHPADGRWRELDGRNVFKAVSNRYLLKHGL